MRVTAATISTLFAVACANDRTTSVENTTGDNDYSDHDAGLGDAGHDAGSDGSVDCGPDRTLIVFAAQLDGQAATDLYVVDPHGGVPTPLTSTPGAELWPAWSPDRTQVAFVRDAQLFVLDLATGTERLVAERVGRAQQISGAAWSPDGTRLVYPYPREPFPVDLGEPDGIVDESYATTLHIVNADGTNDVALTEQPETGNPPGMGTFAEAAWSSTNVIAFNLGDDCPDCAGGWRYAFSQPDGTAYGEIQPADLGVYPLYPRHGLDWSPDGTRWVFTASANELKEAPGVIATRSVDNPDDIRALTPDGAWYPRYAPDGSTIAFLRADGIYAIGSDGAGEHRVLSVTGVRGLDW